MTESYEVYVGNLVTSVSKQELQNLFLQVGQIVSIWINPIHKQITYGFIGFADLTAANEACEQFNNRELNLCKIKVKMSNRTKLQQETRESSSSSSSSSTTTTKGILLELPKKTGCSKSHILKKIFVKNLRQNQEIVKDFAMACKEAENIAFPKRCEMIKTNSEQSDLSTLEKTIIRNFKTPRQKNTVLVDFDLSKGKLMPTEQYDKYFNLQLLTPRSVTQPKQKKAKPFELDYRAVCE